jgi:nucleotide-binding universal stress UspA family protein
VSDAGVQSLSLDADQLLLLTETQAAVFEGLYNQNRVLVEGVAGSGKTLLALRRALAFARVGKRTLLVCYNRELAAWLEQLVEDDPLTGEYKEVLTIRNFHALAAELAQAANSDFGPAGGGGFTPAFWTDEVPDLMEQASLALDLAGRLRRHRCR